ncbi:MAG: isoleucine--tRNA ligase [Erysipelotrichales bacterium]|nr:isoleucine--tRNA ligase [Erysipelotrichales bacterium]
MKNFKELDKRSVFEVESSILAEWQKQDILNKTIENRTGKDNWVFFDGPATANGMPGLHHMVAKFLKDTFCKYQTMKGMRVLRKVGWDTHGLPVEVNVEKKLGFSGKADIEKYGIEEFNKLCKETVWDNETAFRKLTNEMGQFIDLDNRYITYDNDYIETEWYILKKFFDEGLFYEGVKIMPWCPRCGTGLASHEVAQGYKEIDANTVIVPFKRKDMDAYFLVWTTTPWTLISNVALCVNPNEDYVLVESKGYKFILADALKESVLGDEFEVLETMKGIDLENVEYEQLIPSDIEITGKAFIVTCDNYVTMSDGTGIVHIAPAFGEDDAKVGKKYKLPYVNPVAEDATYNAGLWKDMNIFEADLKVIDWLKENDKLFKKQKIKHDYPHCWRCDSPLVYYSRPSYYLEVTKLQEKIIAENNNVNWYPSYVGEKRFGNWLENMNDWAISRNRYWGTPLPLWRCSCGHMEMLGSREELADRAVENVDPKTIDLHRPYVDDIHIVCPKCSEHMNRVPEVIDCWFDSGAMPFAQYHYPFENKELWESQYPADFIAEGIDQTRGWFYSLIVIGVFLTGKSPYKNVLVNELLLDKFGKKMHKSKGNAIEPFTLMEQYGADTIRWYLPYVSPTWTPLKFDEDGLKEVYSKFFNPYKNTYSFFQMYANIDGIDIDDCRIEYENREEIDKWLLSKYNKLLKSVTESYEKYDLNEVVKNITTFVSEDLSNWYIRRNRNRFWASSLDDSKKAVYMTTYEVLVGLSKMCAPIIPFTTEEVYKNLTGEESVHLADFPKYDESLINEEVEIKMDLVRDLISTGRYVREETKIKVRQPISECLIDAKYESILGDLVNLINEELNVKKVTFVDDLSKYMNFTIKPNFKVCGAMFGPKMKDYQNALLDLSDEEVDLILKEETVTIDFDGARLDIKPDMVDVRIESKEGFNVGMENNKFIILNTELSHELVLEGLAREFVSKVQNLRKSNGYEIADRIKLYYDGDKDILEALEMFKDYIKEETLAVVYENVGRGEVVDINGHDVNLYIEKN